LPDPQFPLDYICPFVDNTLKHENIAGKETTMKKKQEQPPERYLTVVQVAKRLGLSSRSIHNRICDGNIPAIQLPGMFKFVIPESALNQYINSARKVHPNAAAEKAANLPDL